MKPTHKTPSNLHSIIIVQILDDRWSYCIVKNNERVYNSSASWPTPEECWDEAIQEFKRLELN